MKILFLDTETTGKDPELAEIVELGFCLSSDGTILKEYDQLIKPSEPIPPEASAVHHITNAMLADSPDIGDASVIENVQLLVEEADYICAHNLHYDLTLLKRFMPSIFRDIDASRQIDTLRLAKHVIPGLPSYSLQALRYRFGFHDYEGQAHRALIDAYWVSELLQLCMERGGVELDGIADFIAKPIMLEKMPFGKHRGREVLEAMRDDPGWFAWFARQPWRIEHPDLLYTVAKIKAGGGR